MADEKTGPEMVDKMAEEPTLDRFFDRNPSEIGDDELRQLIDVERQRRALFIEKKHSK